MSVVKEEQNAGVQNDPNEPKAPSVGSVCFGRSLRLTALSSFFVFSAGMLTFRNREKAAKMGGLTAVATYWISYAQCAYSFGERERLSRQMMGVKRSFESFLSTLDPKKEKNSVSSDLTYREELIVNNIEAFRADKRN